MWPFKRKRKEVILNRENQALFTKVKNALVKEFKIPEEKITLKARFREDFGFDSVDTVQANIALEEMFNLEIPDEDIEKILTVQNLINYLDLKLNNPASP